MIARLRGTLVERRADEVVVDVHGVGYLVSVPQAWAMRAELGAEVTLFIATVIREDAFLLFGFPDGVQREAFDVLRGVNRVGPKLALAILSALPVADLARAIAKDEVAVLAKVPGVGRKSAERLCLELKDKLPVAFVPTADGGAPVVAEDPLPLALARLSYRKSEIDRAMADPSVPDYGSAPVEQRLRAALHVLAQPS